MSSQTQRQISQLSSVDTGTIQDKFLVGYQGWFQCAGDGQPIHRGHHGWVHWITHPLNGSDPNRRPNIDFWPDTTGYTADELYPVPGLNHSDGTPAKLWSSRHPRTVRRHFHLMAQYGVDGVFLQRFATHLKLGGDNEENQYDLLSFRDEIGDIVRNAAEAEGRVFAIMYDVTGLKSSRLVETIKTDWTHLVQEKKVVESPNYLKESGRPVVGLWGIGFTGHNQDPEDVAAVVRFIRDVTPGGAYIMGGTPTYWASLSMDQDPDPRWLELYYSHFDAISPWTVGRFSSQTTADIYGEQIVEDLKSIKVNSPGRNLNLIPVVFPGFSSHYLSNEENLFNQIPRDGGKFLWRQLFNSRRSGARTIYAAMWDEYDEGTALLPIVSSKRNAPGRRHFLALDVDGYDIPSDWYMRIVGLAAEALHDGRSIAEGFPKKILDDYWSTRNFRELELPATVTVNQASATPTDLITSMDDPPPPYTPATSTQTSNPFLGLLMSSHPESQTMTAPSASTLQPGILRHHQTGSPVRLDAGGSVSPVGIDHRLIQYVSPVEPPPVQVYDPQHEQAQRHPRWQLSFPREQPRDSVEPDTSGQPAVPENSGELLSSRQRFPFPLPHTANDGNADGHPLATSRDAEIRPPLSHLSSSAHRQYYDPVYRPYGPRPPPTFQRHLYQHPSQFAQHPSLRQHLSQQPDVGIVDAAWQTLNRVTGRDVRQQLGDLAETGWKSIEKFSRSRNQL